MTSTCSCRKSARARLSFGAGFSSIDSLVGQIELTQANFDITNWRNGFTGGGQRFRLLLEYGLTRKDFVLSLTEPYFLDTHTSPWAGNFSIHDSELSFSNDYNQQNLGFGHQRAPGSDALHERQPGVPAWNRSTFPT